MDYSQLSAVTVLASGSGASTDVILSTMWIAVASLLAPVVSYMTGKRVPAVVFLLVFGYLIGPHALGLATSDESNALLRELGLGMLFLLAGWEINPEDMRGTQARAAWKTWAVSLLLAVLGATVLVGLGDILTAVVIGIAVSSTAMGTLLPILKTSGISKSPVGRGVLVHGAVGELGPIFAMALLLGTRSTWLTILILFTFMGGALLVAFVPKTVAKLVPWVGRAVIDGASHTNQTVMRSVIVLLTVLMAMAAVFELDVVLGAFAAGIILRALVPARSRMTVEARLDVLGYGLLIPVFFVTSGMGIDMAVVVEKPQMLLLAVVTIFIARGMPILLAERFLTTNSGLNGFREQLQLALYGATGLPIIVAVTEVAVSRELLRPENASLLVCAGAATVLLFPLLAAMLDRDEQEETEEEAAERERLAQQEAAEYRAQREAAEAKLILPKRAKAPKSSTVDAAEITLDD